MMIPHVFNILLLSIKLHNLINYLFAIKTVWGFFLKKKPFEWVFKSYTQEHPSVLEHPVVNPSGMASVSAHSVPVTGLFKGQTYILKCIATSLLPLIISLMTQCIVGSSQTSTLLAFCQALKTFPPSFGRLDDSTLAWIGTGFLLLLLFYILTGCVL